MLALKFDGSLKLVEDAAMPSRAGEALVRVRLAGICNTDIEITRGYATFRGTPGHEFVGEVVSAPGQTLVGRRVVGEINAGCGSCPRCHAHDPRHCLTRSVLGIVNRDGAFAEYLSLPVENLLTVPDELPDEIAVFAEPLAAACEVTNYITAGERVAVIGDGKLGLLIAQVVKQAGCQLLLIGKHRGKMTIARRAGIEAVLLAEMADLKGEFDAVIEASGAAAAMTLALDLVRPAGRIILKSTYAGELSLDASRIVVNEISVIGSRCGRFENALPLLVENKIDVQSMIARTFPLSESLAAFQYAQTPGVLKVLVKP